MHITIDTMSAEPIYKQLRQSIIDEIARGSLRAGDKMPSVRALAQDLGINLHTVSKVYQILDDEGYLISVGRRGVYVAEVAQIETAGLTPDQLEHELRPLAKQWSASGLDKDSFIDVVEHVFNTLLEM